MAWNAEITLLRRYMTPVTEDQWIMRPSDSAGGSYYHCGSGLTRGARVQFAENLFRT